MAGANSWRAAVSGQDWMREVEKRILHEERRPTIRTAADLLGPGIGPLSVLIGDWNAPETAFNGLFHSVPDAYHSPDPTRYWMGTSQVTPEGSGLQRVSEYAGHTTDVTWPRPTYLRKFFTPGETLRDSTGFDRVFSAWKVEDNTPIGLISQYADPAVAPNGWLLCNGAVLVRTDYPDLFAVIGVSYNTGGETGTQFRIPNIAGRVIKV